MQSPVYLLCVILLAVVVRGEDSWSYLGKHLQPLDISADEETLNYLLPRLTAKYRPSNQWTGVADPRFYILSALANNHNSNEDYPNSVVQDEQPTLREKKLANREQSLSIVSNLAALRDRLLMEIAKKKMQEGADKNREMLNSIGKRSNNHPQN